MRTSGFVALVIAAMLIVASVVSVTAAQSTPVATPAGASGLPEVRWELAEATLADGTVHEPDDPALYFIQFLPDGAVVARADCNQVAGAYELDGDSLSLTGLATTLVGCPEGSLGTDYTAWLEQISSFELMDDTLILNLDDGGRLRFTVSLIGVVWEWQRFLGGNDSVLAPDSPDRFTLQFEADGRILVRADCNSGNGSVELSGPAISFGAVALSRAYCGDESLDREFLRLLDEVTSFVYFNGQLGLGLPVDAGVLIFIARATNDGAAPAVEATPGTD